MNPANMLRLVRRNVQTFGQNISWNDFPLIEGEREQMVPDTANPIARQARAIIVKEKYAPIASFAASIGISFDSTSYLIGLPDLQIEKNMVITDESNQKWKLDVVEPWRIGSTPVAKISSLTEVS